MLPDTSMDPCLRVLEPYHPKLWTVPHHAWDRYMEIPDSQRVALARWKRGLATTVWAFMMEAAQALFHGDPGIRMWEEYETLNFEVINGGVMFRFKKMDSDGRTSNYPTARARSYNNSTQYEMFESIWSAPIRVDVGYFTNDVGTQIDHVWVARRVGEEVDWRYEILPPAEPVVIPFPEPSTSPVPEAGERVVARHAQPVQQQVDPKAGA